MDLSCFDTFTMEEQQHIPQADAEYVNQHLIARRNAPARSALDAAGKKESTHAQYTEPRSSINHTTADPVLGIARKSAQEQQQQQRPQV